MMSIARKLSIALLCQLSAHVWADAANSEYTLRRSPTMAVFYSVEEDGRSVREDIDTAVIADPHAKPSRTVVTGRPKAKQQVQPGKIPRATVVLSAKPKRHDSFAELRCERYGFYYTSRGDCIVPAASYIYVLQANKPKPVPYKGLKTPLVYAPGFWGQR
jgi:hypothetical protein